MQDGGAVESMFRFRTVDKLLGHQELEEQYIYFASSDELNDPLEGTLRYFWRGDRIIWTNLLRHYLMCLEHAITLARLTPDTRAIVTSDLPIYSSLRELPTDQYRQRLLSIYKIFFSDHRVQAYVNWLSANPASIYREEMYVHLRSLSQIALHAVFEEDRRSGMLPGAEQGASPEPPSEANPDITKAWQELEERPDTYQKVLGAIYESLKSQDSELMLKYRNSPKAQSIFVAFPQLYLNAIVGLTYPKAYIASFANTCLDASMWGAYGQEHTGVCLEFSEGAGGPHIALNTKVGYNGKLWTYDYRDYSFQAVTYSSDSEVVDFFRRLGRLSVMQLDEQWYCDDDGNRSVCGDVIQQDEGKWREEYWRSFPGAHLTKTPDWKHEKEYRLVLASGFDTFESAEDRKLQYKFEDLRSIVFGIRTPTDARATIVDMVRRKCDASGRREFPFFEVAYSEQRREWHLRELNVLAG